MSFSCILHFIHQEILLVLHKFYIYIKNSNSPPTHIHFYHLIQVISYLDWISEVASYLVFLLSLPSVFSRIAKWPLFLKVRSYYSLRRILWWPFISLIVKAKVSAKPCMIQPYLQLLCLLYYTRTIDCLAVPQTCWALFHQETFACIVPLSNFLTFHLMAHVN